MNKNGPPKDKRPPLPNGPGHGRPKGSKNKVTIAMLEEEYRRIAFSNLANCFERTAKSARTFKLRELIDMPEDMQRCIASMKVRTENLSAGDGAQDTTVEIKLWDKMDALEKWAKHFGWAKDTLVVEGADVVDILKQRHARHAKADAE